MKKSTNNTIKTLSKTLVVASILASVATPATAKSYNTKRYSNVQYAQVVGVTPVVEKYRVNNPVEQCWDERVRTQSHASRSRTPEILGGLIGAVLGHEVGRGRGKDVATVAGAVLGASVGRDVRRSTSQRGSSYEVVQHCEIRDSYTTRERVIGYDVAYRFNGRVFHTQMGKHPGKRIRVNVSVNPA